MGKWIGSFTDFGDDFELLYSSEALDDAVIADDHISLDWGEEHDKLGAVLRPYETGEFEIWSGDITSAGWRDKRGELSGVRYDIKGGGVVLIVKWMQDGYGGNGMYEILPK